MLLTRKLRIWKVDRKTARFFLAVEESAATSRGDQQPKKYSTGFRCEQWPPRGCIPHWGRDARAEICAVI